ncbi:MAG: helix-turn-helix transcriptional regulator [Deltaproteobacteria bacterium]|nr:helix-turn-helix transcriptional regulator [Deltaproteobacteria bacterium]
MLETTKKPPIENVVLRFVGPSSCREEAVRILVGLGFSEASEVIPWREAFPEYGAKKLAGIALRGARGKEGVTQARLSEITGIPQRHISEMENGKRPIGVNMAKRLGKVLKISYKVFL